MKKIYVFVIVCVMTFGLAGLSFADTLSPHRTWGIWDNVSFNSGATSQNVAVGQWYFNEDINAFSIQASPSGQDWGYKADDVSSFFSNTVISAIQGVIATYEYLVTSYTGVFEDANQRRWGAVAQACIWELVYDGVLPSDASVFSDGVFQSSFAQFSSSIYPHMSIGDATAEFLSTMNSGIIDPTTIYITTYYTPEHNADRASFISYGSGPSQPVPVPAAVWLMGTGIAGLVAARRKLS